jgi:GPH family glycoside/pentoside/hexuronide:cation symporter
MKLSYFKYAFHNKLRVYWLFYATGFLGVFLINSSLTSILLYRYDPGTNAENLPVLVPTVIAGAAFFAGRVIGAIFQPVAGYLSDQTQGKWGKRRPYLAASTPAIIGSFIFLFNPLITETSRGNSLYLISFLCIFYFALALYQVPYLAWLTELAPQNNQRVQLSSWLAISSLVGMVIGAVGTPWLTARYGFSVMTLIIGSISLLSLLVPLITPELAVEENLRLPLLTVLRASWRNNSFRPYVLGISTAWVAMSILAVCPPFFAIALLHKDVSFGGLINALVLGGSAFSIVILRSLVSRLGKRQTFQFSMLWSGCCLVLLTIFSVWSGPQLPFWLVFLPLSSLAYGCNMILPNAMMSDIIEQDLSFGQSAQAIYFGSRGLFRELSTGLGIFISGFLLSLGNTASEPRGVQLALIAAALFVFLSAFFWMIYPISK